MKLYSTVRGAASAEQIIEKSRFIAYVAPVSDREEAEVFITSIRKKHIHGHSPSPGFWKSPAP